MAVFVKTIPTLCGSVADRFSEQASTNEENRASVDYTEQVESSCRCHQSEKCTKDYDAG